METILLERLNGNENEKYNVKAEFKAWLKLICKNYVMQLKKQSSWEVLGGFHLSLKTLQDYWKGSVAI